MQAVRTNPNQSILLTHLARKILLTYPSATARERYYREAWQPHHGAEGVEQLRGFVSRELANFYGWSALKGVSAAFSRFPSYLEEVPASVLSDRPDNQIVESRKVSQQSAPWWSDLPWLAPNSSAIWKFPRRQTAGAF